MSDNLSDLTQHLESIVDDLKDKHDHSSSSSSSDSEDEKKQQVDGKKNEIREKVRSSVHRIFGRENPVHKVLGGGKSADIFLWRDKKISGSVLGIATAVWVLFEVLEYHLVTLVCHILMLSLAVLFLWSNASTFINKSPPHIPKVAIPEFAALEFASALRVEINRTFVYLRDIATGKDFKMFLAVIAGLWIVSILGSYLNFITLFYLAFMLMHTLPALYEKHEDHVDSLAEKAAIEFKKQYAVFDAKVISKLPRSISQIKKFN